MDIRQLGQRENALIFCVILAFALVGFWLRILPMEQLTSGPVHKVIFMDPWYSMRQIEVIASNFLQYPWFDPMCGYPTGKIIDWGPVYPTFSALIVMLLGASTREEMMTVASWIPPFLSLAMIPVMYYTGKLVNGRKTGIIAACLISVIAGEYLYRSFFGYLDHHFMEVLLSSLFMLLYLFIIRADQNNPSLSAWKNRSLILVSVLAGITYYLGLMNMPTMMLFAVIIGLFCFLHTIINREENSLIALSVAHGIIFGGFIVLYAITGIHAQGLTLAQYTPIHILLALLMIIEPVFLYGAIRYTREKSRFHLTGLVIGIPAIIYLILSVILPEITKNIAHGFTTFFFFSYQETFINEMQMWDATRAWHSFNIALLIMAVGIIITAYYSFRPYNALKFCSLVWAFVILSATILHLRYEYYVAVIVVLFASAALAWLYDQITRKKDQEEVKKPGEKKAEPIPDTRSRYIALTVVGLIVLIITGLSAQTTCIVAKEQLGMIGMNDDWADALTWLDENSPESGIDPLKIYEKEGFSYPQSSYGVLSWWDYGHWISYLASRIPITTPFQNNLNPVAKFLISTEEEEANRYANQTGARYIIIDYEMINSKYPSIPLWAEGQAARDRFQKYYYQQSKTNPSQYEPVLTLKPDFFTSMVSRLYIFDGSMRSSTGSYLVKYTDAGMEGERYPAVSSIVTQTPEQTREALSGEIPPRTDIVSIQYTHPVPDIPALTRYRLVYESPTVIASDELEEIHTVKIFERVEGFKIPGSGTLELPLVSNQGRVFTYRQMSSDGGFIVPYSTEGNPYGVRATGPYVNLQTGEKFTVTEKQVLQGT